MQRVLTAWQGRKIPVGWKRLKKHRFGALLLGLSGVWLLRSYKTSPPHHLAEDKCKEHRLQIHANDIQVMLWLCTGSYTRVNFALAAQGHQGIKDNEQTGSEFTEIQVKVSCETVINVIKMIMFISMYLLKIIQLVTVQRLLMFHFWATEQIPCISDLALIRYQPDNSPLADGLEERCKPFSVGLLTAGKHFSWKIGRFAVEHVYSRNGFKKKKKKGRIKVMTSPEKRFPCQGVFVW